MIVALSVLLFFFFIPGQVLPPAAPLLQWHASKTVTSTSHVAILHRAMMVVNLIRFIPCYMTNHMKQRLDFVLLLRYLKGWVVRFDQPDLMSNLLRWKSDELILGAIQSFTFYLIKCLNESAHTVSRSYVLLLIENVEQCLLIRKNHSYQSCFYVFKWWGMFLGNITKLKTTRSGKDPP